MVKIRVFNGDYGRIITIDGDENYDIEETETEIIIKIKKTI